MQRTTVTFLLIAIILFCPYLCLGEEAGSESAPSLISCCYCIELQDRSSNETPETPNDNEPDCQCHGAIMDGVRPAVPDLSTQPAINWLIDDAVLFPIHLSLETGSFEPPHQFPPFSTGRDVCALTCTLLL